MATVRKTSGSSPTSQDGVILVSVFDGSRNPIPAGKELLFRLRDGTQKEVVTKIQKNPSLRASLPFANNFQDKYAVIVSGTEYGQAGFHPVPLKLGVVTPVDLMLLQKDATFRFHDAVWSRLRMTHPKWTAFLKGALTEEAAEEQYGEWLERTPTSLAAFLNFAEALDDVAFRVGTVVDYLKGRITPKLPGDFSDDRFFAFADNALVEQLGNAVEAGTFEHANSALHPGATRSFKEVRFGEANVQVTLHENDRKQINGTSCLKIEIDMDYFRDPLAHLLLEVLPNQFGSATDPRQVYMLRWIAGRRAGVTEFNPPYSIA